MEITTRSCSSAVFMLALIAVACMPAQLVQGQAAAPAPDLSAVPEACINGGTDLQTLCADAITAAQAYFNVPAGATPGQALNITDEQVQNYVQTAPLPSAECCTAACNFNANYCNCEKSVLDFATQLTGGNINVYVSIGTAFQKVCNIHMLYGETCPTPALRATLPKQDCSTAVPTPIAAGNATAGNATAGNATATAPGTAAVLANPAAAAVPADPAAAAAAVPADPAAAAVPAANATPTATAGK